MEARGALLSTSMVRRKQAGSLLSTDRSARPSLKLTPLKRDLRKESSDVLMQASPLRSLNGNSNRNLTPLNERPSERCASAKNVISTALYKLEEASIQTKQQQCYVPSFQEKCRRLRERLALLEANSMAKMEHHSSNLANPSPKMKEETQNQQPIWKIGELCLKPLRKLGKGASGTVFEARIISYHRQNQVEGPREVAVKVMPLWHRTGFKREVEFMQALGPLDISTTLYATIETDKSLMLVMSKAEMSLYDKVHSLPPERRRLGQEECRRITKELVILVDAMHKRGFVHFDLKPDNILITAESDLVLCDSSLAATLSETKTEKYFLRGTRGYMSPEVVNADPIIYPFAADMYSIGIILTFLRDSEPKKPVSSFRLGYLIEDTFPYEHYDLANDLLGGLLIEEPHLRFTASDVLNHPWLTDVRLGARSIRWWKHIGLDRHQELGDLALDGEVVKEVIMY